MFSHLLSTRKIQVGIAFFVIVVAGSLLYRWHVVETTKAELAERPTFQARPENLNATATGTGGQPPSGLLATSEAPASPPSDETRPAREAPANLQETQTSVFDDFFSEVLPADVHAHTDVQTAETPVSPNGFGPLPAVPSDYPDQNVWSEERLARITPEHELLSRVRIELWNQGVRTEGAVYRIDYGRIYPTTDDVVYIEWDDAPAADGEMYVVDMLGTPKTINAYEEDIYRGIFPPHLTIYEYPDGGIDPYTFLGL